ncbi:MAG: ATP-binding protein [Kofleriaceae bacterium]
MTAFVENQLLATRLRIEEAVDLAKTRSDQDLEAQWLDRCEQREAQINAQATIDVWPLLRLNLSATAQRVLWVLITHELDPIARMKLRELATDDEVDLTYDVLRRVVYGHSPSEPSWSEFSEKGPLRSLELIETQDAHVPLHRTAFRIANRMLALVHGSRAVDSVVQVVTGRKSVPFDELVVADAAKQRVLAAFNSNDNKLVLVLGPSGAGKRSLITSAARVLGRAFLPIDARDLDKTHAAAKHQLRIFARECMLGGCYPLILNLDALLESDDKKDRVALVESLLLPFGTVFATSITEVARRWKEAPVIIELDPLSGLERSAVWKRAIPEASAGDADLLSTLYPLAPALISSVAAVAKNEAMDQKLEPKHIATAIRHVLDDRLAGLATRVDVTQDWDDLILPEDQTMGIVEMLSRVRVRRRVYEDWGFAKKLGKGLGVSALFSGPPGTGKTMCAGLIAKDLGTELYQVDLGKIVSKWVGETEKNLAALFDAAEASHAVLLFDEADSLFGKRTSTISSSNDRYANQEVNFLLQRIEAFTGICILTTNHDPAIDEAFLRRISVRVRFPMPDEDERVKLWRALLPKSAPASTDIDFTSLAKKYVMAGGNIRNAVLRAAFFAADADETINNHYLKQAAQLEYESMGKLAYAG